MFFSTVLILLGEKFLSTIRNKSFKSSARIYRPSFGLVFAKTGSLNSGIGHFNSVILTGTLIAVGTQGLKEVTDPPLE